MASRCFQAFPTGSRISELSFLTSSWDAEVPGIALAATGPGTDCTPKSAVLSHHFLACRLRTFSDKHSGIK